ncbi:MAG: trypsin-like peptidase domain-containing protein [Deltaproteobacteria bacterium]|nr:trypsin-like peptidase domain-containing protein [Deltaproteobacteria bacterium]
MRWRGAAVAFAAVVTLAPRLHAEAPPLWREGKPNRTNVPLSQLVSRARAGVVQVRGQLAGRAAYSASGRLSVGTGFVISAEGYVITNEHVVREAEELQVRLADGRELSACVQGVDAITDIALLKVRSPRPLAPLPLGDPASVKEGDDVFVIGNPFGFDHSVTAGILSAKDRIVERQATAEAVTTAPYAFYLQTDAAINMGNSGGPLLSSQGFVVGVASAFWGGAQPAQGIGFAIPIDVVKQLLPSLASTGRVIRSWMGVDVQSVDPALADAFGLPSTQGALLAAVAKQGPAAVAGLKAGDVMVAWGKHALAGVEDFKIYAQLTPAGQKVDVRVLRQGVVVKVPIVTGSAPSTPAFVPHPAACASKLMGGLPALGLDYKSAEGGGVVVRKVSAGAARLAGLLPGDVITQVNDVILKDAADFTRALVASNKPHPILIHREDSFFWVSLPAHLPPAPAP